MSQTLAPTSAVTPESARFVVVDEDGYFSIDGIRMADQEVGAQWLSTMRKDERGRALIEVDGQAVIIEAFDHPLTILDIEPGPETHWRARFNYGYETNVDSHSLSCDEWDRFFVRTENGLRAALSRSAQSRLFQQATAYDDTSVTFDTRTIEIAPYYGSYSAANDPTFWSDIYKNETPRWDNGAFHPGLPRLIPPLKLTRCRVLVLGCGNGHDAHWWSQQGHIVTGVDFAPEAIENARATYGESSDLKWVQADAFKLPTDWNERFDIIFEHTFFCAINPARRPEVLKLWRRLLSSRGRLLGFVPIMDKPEGPPFGCTEWEFRTRLLLPPRRGASPLFLPLIWSRDRESLPKRLGQELFFVVERRD